ncbi:MAG TPA: dTDP-4-dehydrorhamnose reductase [Vicinamibacterales bacterium]|nr:dTDP-4-dehydrorhamnose reductase [Vicinamibacterales bacterium]
MTGRRVFVTGGSGQLGSAILDAFADAALIAPSHRALDLGRHEQVAAAIADARPEVIVNCAAFNDVDGAEDRPLEAFALNAFAVRSLARAAEQVGATLVHFSTDFVFDGTAREPYREDSAPAPRSTYASSKLAGEWFALDAPRAFVLRVESLFGTPRVWSGRRGSLEAIVAGLEEGREVRVFSDRIVSPGYVRDIAAATRHLVDAGATAGLYHCVNSGQATWLAIAEEAARLLRVEPRLNPVSSAGVTLRASRPQYSALDTTKLAAAGFPMPAWQDALRRWLASRDVPSQAAALSGDQP